MKKLACLILVMLAILGGCQTVESQVTILADGQTYSIRSADRLPTKWLSRANITLGENDRLIYRGESIPVDQALPESSAYSLVVRRALQVSIHSPEGEKTIQTSASTVGEAMAAAGYELHPSDLIEPPADTPLEALDNGDPMVIDYQPSQPLSISADGHEIQIRSAAASVGQALAQAGMPLVGLDYSIPPESSSLPVNGKVKIVRVSESVALTESTIPYGTRTELSADLEIDQQGLLQGGEPGLKISRIRSRLEDGEQVSQKTDGESIVRPPQDRVMGIGTKINIRTATVDGQTFEYWRTLTLYATPYHPCDASGKCWYNTSMGTKVRRGEAALVYPWYLLLAGEQVYVPGYGFATIEDNNGANTSAYWGTYWIDLGYAQDDTIDWVNHYVTVYFLTPVPANIADLYLMP